MRNTGLQVPMSTEKNLLRIQHHIHKCNAIQTNHLFKIDVAVLVPVDVLNGYSLERSIRTRFEDVAKLGATAVGCGQVQKDRVGA